MHVFCTNSFCFRLFGSIFYPPHAQREWGKVIGVGVHYIYKYIIYVCGPQIIFLIVL